MEKHNRLRALLKCIQRSYKNTWAVEIFMVALSISCLVATIVILSYADGGAIRVWHGFTLNTLIAILSNSSQAAAALALSASISQWCWCQYNNVRRRKLLDFETFNNASRGPLGCIQLLFCERRVSFVWVGALTVIALITFNPFTQQLVQYDQESVESNNTGAWLPRATRYSQGRRQIQHGVVYLDGSQGKALASADFSMQSAIQYGLVSKVESVVQQLDYRCPSQECNWPLFDSLAVCSRCEDLTNALRAQNHPDQDSTNTVGTLMDSGDVLARDRGLVSSFSLPNGLYIDGVGGWVYDFGNNTSSGTYMPNAFMTSYGTTNPSLTNAMQSLNTLILSMSMIRITPGNDPAKTAAWPEVPLEAIECALYYCVNEYNSTFVNGTMFETVKEQTEYRRTEASWKPIGDNYVSWNDSQVQDIAFDEMMSYAPRTDLMLGERYNISQIGVDGISQFMQSTFGSTSAKEIYDNNNNITTRRKINGWYIAAGGDASYSPPLMQTLQKTGDLSETFRAVALSMSNSMRADSDDLARTEGQTVRSQTVYRIQWIWIILPACLVLSSAVQLIASIVQTARTRTPLWKTSALAALSRGPFAAEALKDAGTLLEMEEAASKACLSLFDKPGHAQLLPEQKDDHSEH